MMPLALDLISTFVIGSTLPVATTDLIMVPRSAVAMRDGSTSGAAPFSVAKPAAPARTASAMPPPMYTPLPRFMKGCDGTGSGEVQLRYTPCGFGKGRSHLLRTAIRGRFG